MVPLEYVAHRGSLHTRRHARRGDGDPARHGPARTRPTTPSSQLSQVELRKLELARAMAARPRLLISDEAMAGLSSNEVDEVLEILFKLNAAGITIIMIEHIMQAVMKFSQRVVCLDAGRIICEGTPAVDRAGPRRAEGLPWRLSSPSTASTPAMARCARCTAFRFACEEGETVALLGTNGNGKSTLMKCVMGMVRPTQGQRSS